MRVVAIIPARGGSKGIPRKNIKIMNGKPLIGYAIDNALSVPTITDVIVSTDDEEIADVATLCGARVIMRPEELATDAVTLDPVINHVCEQLGDVDIVITMQPTSPCLTAATLSAAIDDFIANDYDTVISVVNMPHLSWGRDDEGKLRPNYVARLNRQQLPPHYNETGAFVITKREFVTPTSRFGKNISVFEVPERESVDIDTKEDWLMCEHQLSSKRIVIFAEASQEIGTGHIFRAIMLASALFENEVRIVTTRTSTMGIEKLKASHMKYDVIDNRDAIFEYLSDYQPDILINDILDTEADFVIKEKEIVDRVVNFEDIGPGTEYADAVINSLLEPMPEVKGNVYWGEKYYCLRDEFLMHKPKAFSEKVQNVLIAFGGTDPSGFTERILDVVEQIPDDSDVKYTVILGIGYQSTPEFEAKLKNSTKNIECLHNVKSMARLMNEADLAISSQGRTIYELASQQVPTIIMSHSAREATHVFGFMHNGFINLGNGNDITNDTIVETVLWLMHSPQVRQQMRDRMSKIRLERGIERVKEIICQQK